MARTTERPPNPWIAFAAGAVVMLLLVLVWFAWDARDETGLVARAAIAAARVLPDIEPPRAPDAPRLPDNPIPRPR